MTLRTGFFMLISSGGDLASTQTLDAIPIGLDVTVSPDPRFDLGASFQLAGVVGESGASTDGYADFRCVTFWLRFRM